NESVARGLKYFGRTGDDLDQPGIMLYETLGCGGGTLDFDRDGWQDIYLAAAGGMPPERDSQPNELFRNMKGQFVPIGAVSGVADTGFGQGVCVGDLNSDGFPDLLVLNYGPNRLYLNQGDGRFRDASDLLPPEPYDEWSTCAAMADLNGNGLTDIFIVNYCAGLGPVIQPCQGRSCSPMVFSACEDRIVESTPDGNLEVHRDSTPPAPGRGLGLVIGQLEGQPGNDVLVANDMTNNHFYAQDVIDERPVLRESAMIQGLSGDDRGIPQGSMGIASGDFDGDGDLDFYVTNFDGEYNTLYRQEADGIWQDRTSANRLIDSTLPQVGFGTEAIDVDNDGDLELFLVNGHVDIFSREGDSVEYPQSAQVFQLAGDSTYQEVNADSIGDYFRNRHVGRSLWTIDANRDGRIDLLATHQTEPVALLVNQTPSSYAWVRLELIGTHSGRDAIGARVSVETLDGEVLTGFRMAAGGYQCSNERFVHLGLGERLERDGVVTVIVEWPDGSREAFDQVSINDVSILVQTSGLQTRS
ncbi:MAG: CRTAC1 family protein, partial [Planctomycetota bacterium]